MVTNDIDALHLRRSLTEIADDGVPAGVDLLDRVRREIEPRRKSPLFRKTVAATALSVVAVASIAAVTVGPQMFDELGDLLAGNHGITAEFGEPVAIGQEETIGEVTTRALSARVTEMQVVDGVVEDGQVAIEYAVYGLPPRTPVGLNLVVDYLVLKDTSVIDSKTFNPIAGIGADAHSDMFEEQLPEDATKVVVAFDMHGATIVDGELRLKAELPLSKFVVAEGETPLVEYDENGEAISLAGAALDRVEVGRFDFDITLPVTVVPGDGKRDYQPRLLVPTPHGEPESGSEALRPTPGSS